MRDGDVYCCGGVWQFYWGGVVFGVVGGDGWEIYCLVGKLVGDVFVGV